MLSMRYNEVLIAPRFEARIQFRAVRVARGLDRLGEMPRAVFVQVRSDAGCWLVTPQ